MNRPSTPTELPQRPAPDRRAFRPLLGGIALLLAGMVGTSGCATIIHGTTQQVSISSAPSRAAVAVNGRALGQTPVLADLARKDTHTIQVTLEGSPTRSPWCGTSAAGYGGTSSSAGSSVLRWMPSPAACTDSPPSR